MSLIRFNSPVGYNSPPTANVCFNEPMNLGSPTAPHTSASGPQFLPSFLMGETSANSPLSAATTVPSSIFPSPHRSSRITQHRLSDMKTAVPLDRSARRHASPPTQSLWTSSLALTKNPDVFSENVRHSTPNASFGRSPMLQQGLRPALDSPFGNPRSEIKQEQSHSGPTLLEDDSTAWVTVFGYPSAQASLILDQFSHFGTIEKYLITNNGNWMHLKYQNKIQAKCALNKNGRIFLGNIMIGVRRCTDMEVMRSSAAITLADGLSAKVPSDETKVTMRPPGADFRSPGFLDSPLREVGNRRDDLINHSFTGPPTQKPGTPSAADQRPTSGLTRHSSMRPLTGTYRPPCSALSRTSQNQSFRVPACPKNLAFSPGGRYLCLLERRELQDCMSIFDCQSEWRLVVNVQLPTKDSCGLEWSPDGRYIAVYDSCLHDTVAIFTADGRHLHTCSLSEGGSYYLGVKSIAWSPSGQLLAIGGFDQKCRILNHANWSCLMMLQHPLSKPIDPHVGLSPTGEVLESTPNLDSSHSYRVAIYQEGGSEQPPASPFSATPAGAACCNYEVVSKPIQIPSLKPDPKKPNPKIGVGLCLFSPTGRYLVTRVDNAPGTLWIWRAGLRFSLVSLLIHTSGPVLSAAWDPQSTARLALCIGTNVVFMWTPQGCLAVEVGTHFSVRSLSWNLSGDALLLKSSDEFCLCFLDLDSTSEDEPSGLDEFWRAPTSRARHRIDATGDVALTSDRPDEAFHQDAVMGEETDISDMPRWARDGDADRLREKENCPARSVSASSQCSKSPPTSLRSGWKFPVTTPAFHRGEKTLAAKK